jgi:hypothetical protein
MNPSSSVCHASKILGISLEASGVDLSKDLTRFRTAKAEGLIDCNGSSNTNAVNRLMIEFNDIDAILLSKKNNDHITYWHICSIFILRAHKRIYKIHGQKVQ